MDALHQVIIAAQGIINAPGERLLRGSIMHIGNDAVGGRPGSGIWVIPEIKSKFAYPRGSPNTAHKAEYPHHLPFFLVAARDLNDQTVPGFQGSDRIYKWHRRPRWHSSRRGSASARLQNPGEATGYPGAGPQWKAWSPGCRSRPKFQPAAPPQPSTPFYAGYLQQGLFDPGHPVGLAEVHGHIPQEMLHQLVHHVMHGIARIENRNKNGPGHGEGKEGQEQAARACGRCCERRAGSGGKSRQNHSG